MIVSVRCRLSSPAMIGGVLPRENDRPRSLRPPSIRGVLRFWARALGDLPPADGPVALEAELFGSVKSGHETGQRVRLLPPEPFEREDRSYLLPHRANPNGRDPGSNTPKISPQPSRSSVTLRFSLPRKELLEPLAAVVWTWLHLGSLGRRSRRGYGSLLWVPATEDFLVRSGFQVLEGDQHLAERDSLEQYLRNGLERVREIVGRPVGSTTHELDGEAEGRAGSVASRSIQPYFRLETTDQVFVGGPIEGSSGAPAEWKNLGPNERRPVSGPQWQSQYQDSLEWLLHGWDVDTRGPEAVELGRALGGRLASPMLFRVVPAQPRGFFAVLTWSPQQHTSISANSGIDTFLSRLGITTSLAGRSI